MKIARPLYVTWGVIFFQGPWAKAVYHDDGTVTLHAAHNLQVTEQLNATEGYQLKAALGDRRHEEHPRPTVHPS